MDIESVHTLEKIQHKEKTVKPSLGRYTNAAYGDKEGWYRVMPGGGFIGQFSPGGKYPELGRAISGTGSLNRSLLLDDVGRLGTRPWAILDLEKRFRSPT